MCKLNCYLAFITMQAATVIFIFGFVGVYARALNDGIPHEYAERIDLKDKWVDPSCLAEYGIDPNGSKNETLMETEVYCIMACMYRDDGTMKTDGTMDVDKIEGFKDIDVEEKDFFLKIHNKCKRQVGCQLVQCMFEELKHQRHVPPLEETHRQTVSVV